MPVHLRNADPVRGPAPAHGGGLDLSIITDTMEYGCVEPGKGWMGGRCWKCKPCKAWRSTLRKSDWASRSAWEILGSDGNAWFLTLTFRFKPTGEDGYAHFQRFVKRVRKSRGAKGPLRYICASEFGERFGRYHLHAIIVCHGAPIMGRELRSRWSWGITHARAIKPSDSARVARYVGKYVAKAGRVRASNGWGNQILRVNENVRRTNETANAILEAFPGAKVVAVKAKDGKRIRAPYHLRRPARVVPDLRPREWLGIRPSPSADVYVGHPELWGYCLPTSDPGELEGAEGE